MSANEDLHIPAFTSNVQTQLNVLAAKMTDLRKQITLAKEKVHELEAFHEVVKTTMTELTLRDLQQQIVEIKGKIHEMQSHHETVKDAADELTKILKFD
jgi:archaellum component FlaC